MTPTKILDSNQLNFIRDLNSLDPETKANAQKRFAALWLADKTQDAAPDKQERRTPVVFYFQTAQYYLDQVLADPELELAAKHRKALDDCQKELHRGHQSALKAQELLDRLVF